MKCEPAYNATGKIVGLNLHGIGLIGSIPSEIGLLTGLKNLDLSKNQLQVSLSPRLSPRLRLGLKGLFLFADGVSCNVEWYIRQPWRSTIILCNITSIAYHHTNVYPLSNIKPI